MAAYLLGQRWPALKRPVQLWAGLLIVAIGLSRVALGANWPTNVLGGFAGGLLILWATIYWYEGNYAVILEAFALIAGRGAGQGEEPGEGSQKGAVK